MVKSAITNLLYVNNKHKNAIRKKTANYKLQTVSNNTSVKTNINMIK